MRGMEENADVEDISLLKVIRLVSNIGSLPKGCILSSKCGLSVVKGRLLNGNILLRSEG